MGVCAKENHYMYIYIYVFNLNLFYFIFNTWVSALATGSSLELCILSDGLLAHCALLVSLRHLDLTQSKKENHQP